MAEASSTAATVAAIEVASHTGSYRIKFDKAQFLELVEIGCPKIIYRRKKNHFFGFGGFVVYSQECQNSDFPNAKVMDAIELSNSPWSV
jgi:hypothetical protein